MRAMVAEDVFIECCRLHMKLTIDARHILCWKRNGLTAGGSRCFMEGCCISFCFGAVARPYSVLLYFMKLRHVAGSGTVWRGLLELGRRQQPVWKSMTSSFKPSNPYPRAAVPLESPVPKRRKYLEVKGIYL